MKLRVKPKFPRSENLRITVLRKTVSLRDFKLRNFNFTSVVQNLNKRKSLATQRGDQILESFKYKKALNINEVDETEIEDEEFMKRVVAANFARKFGIEKMDAKPGNQRNTKKITAIKKRKGGKFIFIKYNEP